MPFDAIWEYIYTLFGVRFMKYSTKKANTVTESKIDDYSFKTPYSRGSQDDSENKMFRFTKDNNMDQPLKNSNDAKRKNSSPSQSQSKNIFVPSKESSFDKNISKSASHKSHKSLAAYHHEQGEELSLHKTSSVTKNTGTKNGLYTDAAETEQSDSTLYNSLVNTSVSRNHLKINIGLRILMCLVLVANVMFIPWM